jgi:hypothetical protein
MEGYFKFRFWLQIISIGLVTLVIVCVVMSALYYKSKEYFKKKLGKKEDK